MTLQYLLQKSEHALAQARKNLEEAEATYKETIAINRRIQDQIAMSAERDPETLKKFHPMVSTAVVMPNRYEAWDLESRALMKGHGFPLYRWHGRLTAIGRKVVLTLYIPREEEPFKKLKSFLLEVLPLFMPDSVEDAINARERVACFEIGVNDRHETSTLTLYADTVTSTYELVWHHRWEDETVGVFNSFNECFDYLREHYAEHN